MEPSRHLLFSTNKVALVGLARSLRGKSDAQIELFHYSEQERLDADGLQELVSASSTSKASVLLLATGKSSYLWFDPEHCPSNVELCRVLQNFPELHVNFIVCPTDESARDAWEQNPPDLPSLFRGFRDLLPDSGEVDVWPSFDAKEPTHGENICSLICRAQPAPKVQAPILDQPGNAFEWSPLGTTSMLLGLLGAATCAVKIMHDSNRISELRAVLDSQGKRIEHILKTDELRAKKIVEFDSSIKSHADSIDKLDSTSVSHAKMISEVRTKAESQAKQFQGTLGSESAKLDKRIDDLGLTAEAHGKKIGEFDSSIKLHADSIDKLDSASESHAKMLSELRTKAESEAARQGESSFQARSKL